MSFSLRLTERVIVEQVDKALHVKHLSEPPIPQPVERPTELYVNDELVNTWDE